MNEEKVKNRGWVKNAAIIFLSVMLVLTFFSNTIMNRSLSEVSAQYAQSGAITTRVRGTANIEAVETYEVKSEDSRKVQSVRVQVGDKVEPGDVLFVLAAGDSTEQESLKQELEDLQYQYQVALINAGEKNESGENRTIQRAREKLENAIAERDKNAVTDAEISEAKTALDTATADYEKAKDALTAAGGELTGGDGGNYAPVQAAQAARDAAQTSYNAVLIQYKAAYDLLTVKATAAQAANQDYSVGAYIEYLAAQYKDDADKDDPADAFTKDEMYDAYTAVTDAAAAVESAQQAYNSAVDTYYGSFTPDNSALIKKRDTAKKAMDAAQEKYDGLKAKQTALEAAKDAVVSCQDTLEAALKSLKLEDLDLQKQRNDIADKQAQLYKASGGEGGEVLSDVYGVVKTIAMSAGSTTSTDAVMATIEVPDRGYTATITVTADQAKRVTVGDTAEVTTGYWGSSGISGRLVAIRNDPKNPQTSKLLVFDITGEVESGTQVSLSIGQKSQNYDVIVPNSAIREDSNGKFVLIVVAKSSPLGNRYVATRVDVQVLASDDTNSAVSGGVASYDYVITTSTKPIESGMLVRIAEN